MKDKDNKMLKERLEAAWNVPPMPKGGKVRFMDELDRRQRVRPLWRWRIAVATAVAASIVGVVFFLLAPTTAEQPTQVDLTIAEVKGYYKSLMWSETEYIEQLTLGMDEDTRNELMAEARKVEEGPDSVVEVLQEEMMPDDEKVACIASVYRSHLQSLKRIHALLNDRQAYYKAEFEK